MSLIWGPHPNYLPNTISEKPGIIQDRKTCSPTTYWQILSIFYYLVLEDHNPLYRFEKWGSLHRQPYGKNIPSQGSSKLFALIT